MDENGGERNVKKVKTGENRTHKCGGGKVEHA